MTNSRTILVLKLEPYLLLLLALVAHPLTAHEQSIAYQPAASRITSENAAHHRVGGMDAQGGIGDWFLSNGVICAVISDPSQESVITHQGGFLTDLGLCGRDDDHFVVLYPTLQISLDNVLDVQSIDASVVAGKAQIRTVAEQDGLQVTAVYSANADAPNVLSIQTEITRIASGPEMQRYGEVLLTAHSMPMYDVSITRQTKSDGFAHVENATSPADLTVLIGAGDPGHNIVYGYHPVSAELIRPQQEPVRLASIDMGGTEFTARLTPLSSDLATGDVLRIRQEIIVAAGTAISPVTDQLWINGYGVTGDVGEAGVVLLVEDAEGAAVTHLITPASGKFAFQVPGSGDYRIKVRADGREEVVVAFTVTDELVVIPPIELAAPARLDLPGNQIMRLSFRGLDGIGDPDFIDTRTGHHVRRGERLVRDGSTRHLFLSGDATDARTITLAPGRYRVTASRGPEFSVQQATVRLSSGKTTSLNITPPKRVISTPGYISADFHVHSGQSFDNNLGVQPRLKSYVAQGAEVLVATEHDTIYDFTALIDSMGLSGHLRTVTGTELTNELGNPSSPHGLGHANVFPLTVQPLQPRRGAPKHENHRWRDILAELRSNGKRPIVQLNHPLGETAGGVEVGAYLSHMSVAGAAFSPHQPLTGAPNNVMLDADLATGIRDIDFDVIEVENGNRWGERYQLTRDAWYSLLRQGIRMVAAANSDSHGVNNGDLPANVRNMVFTGSDQISSYREDSFLQAIRDGNLYGTNGPMLEVSLNGTPMGGLATGENPMLNLRVFAADWMKVDRYTLYINGVVVKQGPIDTANASGIPLTIEADAFVTVEVTGPVTEMSGEVIGDVAPFAFTNPIYFDADGDGKWQPPGTPLLEGQQ
jgi:hypothetical protein